MVQGFRYYILIAIALSSTSCVSVNLSANKSSAYEKIFVTPPATPYTEIKIGSADRSWQNPKNGNTISYMSSCNMSAEPNLEILSKMALDGVENLHVIQKNYITFNGREALNTILIGRVDGVPVQADLTVLKKNNCVFNLTYIGSINTFMFDILLYKNFFKEFKIL